MVYKKEIKKLLSLSVITGIVTVVSFAQEGVNLGEDGGEKESTPAQPTSIYPTKTPEDVDNEQRVIRARNLANAERIIRLGDEAFANKDYRVAIDRYSNAEKILREVSKSAEYILKDLAALRQKLAQAYKEYALQQIKEAREQIDVGKFEQAQDSLNRAIEFDNSLAPEAQALNLQIKQLKEQAEIDSRTREENIDPEYHIRLKEMMIKKAEAKVFFRHRLFDRARNAYEDVLVRDPGDQEAINGLRRLYEVSREDAKMRRRAQEAERMAEIEWKWIDPIPPRKMVGTEVRPGEAGVISKETAGKNIHQKLRTIVINQIRFEETPVSTIFNFLKERSRLLDPEQVGVNFMLILSPGMGAVSPTGGVPGAPEPSKEEVDPFADLMGGAAAPKAPTAPATGMVEVGGVAPLQKYDPPISIDFDEIPLIDAIRYICQKANLRYRIEDNAVVILGPNVEGDNFELRFYAVNPALFQKALGGEEGGAGAGEGQIDYQRFFERFGVRFPVNATTGEKASVSYERGTSKLVVRNTPENLRLIEKILKEIDQPIPQVTIEAKFVEVRQIALEELSFKWTFLGHRGVGNPRTYQKGNVDVNVNQGAFTDNLRSITDLTTTLTETLNLDTIIGASEFQTLVYFLDRKSGSDVLSAPKVTVQSGEEAYIAMIEERRFPEDFEQGEFTTTDNTVNYTPPAPNFGEPRQDLGVTLTVTPQVGQDGRTIALDLHPKVVEFLGYDTTFNSQTIIQTAGGPVVVQNRFDTPIFEVREIRTKVSVWDGESVVLGGTIKDNLTKVNDRIPLLGDLPLLGRLFRSQGENSEKRNLLMFVSARIIEPSGLPVREHTLRGIPDFRR